MNYLTDLTLSELKELATSKGFRAFHGKILYQWIMHKQVRDLDAMTDLPIKFRQMLREDWKLYRLSLKEKLTSNDGTVKYLYELPDGHCIETVQIPDRDRLTFCISTQVGCAVRCVFCASGKRGLERNLTHSEIVEQVLQSIMHGGKPPSNIVVMGIGEPLMNFDALAKAISIINNGDGLGIGARRITVSTVGIPDGIRKLAELRLQINLAISLHAAEEEKRQKLIPIARRHGLDEVLEAADEYRHKTTRDVTFEMLLINGVNDLPEDAEATVALLKGRKCTVNLIPFNSIEGSYFHGPSSQSLGRFRKILEDARIPVTVRKSRGTDILAACGQLRLNRIDSSD